LLESGGLAVVGSRHVDEALIDYTMSVGRLAARVGRTLVSGGAKGIDQAAMRGALEAGGKVCGVLADSLEKTTMNREHRNLLLDGQLVLISPYDPSAGFNVGNAMQRNKLIYALADASLVVNADLNKGGTWAGAIEQLDKFKFVPVYIRSTGVLSAGLDVLRKKGAMPWPNPQDVNSFEAVFNVAVPMPAASPQVGFSLFANDGPSDTAFAVPVPLETTPVPQLESTPAEVLFAAVRVAIQQLLNIPMKDAEVAAALNVSNAQAKAWLRRMVDEGVLEKQKKPAGYIVKQSSLFERVEEDSHS
jgi:predicted Rossmann fold nucleotide-binding protein DprA/Smf involved in DNA uptake